MKSAEMSTFCDLYYCCYPWPNLHYEYITTVLSYTFHVVDKGGTYEAPSYTVKRGGLLNIVTVLSLPPTHDHDILLCLWGRISMLSLITTFTTYHHEQRNINYAHKNDFIWQLGALIDFIWQLGALMILVTGRSCVPGSS